MNCKLYSLAASLGVVISASASVYYPGVFPGSTDFEGMTTPDTFFVVPADEEISVVQETPSVSTRPANFGYATTQNDVIELDTSSAVERYLNNDKSAASGTIFADLLIKPSSIVATSDTPSAETGDQLLVYLKETSSGNTNLCVYAGGYIIPKDPTDPDAFEDTIDQTPQEFILQSSDSLNADTWYRVVIKTTTVGGYPAFSVYLGGYGASFLCTATKDGNNVNEFLSLTATANATPSVKALAFKGSGRIDDFVVSSNDPSTTVSPVADLQLSWPTGYTPVSYKIGNDEAVEIPAATSPHTITGVATDATIAFTFTNADGASKTLTAVATDIDASTATFTWADYLGKAIAGAYQIDDFNDLDMLRKGVAANLATVGVTFKQTADIALDSAWDGIGIQNGKDICTTAEFDEGAFRGTYDGGNYTISNFQMVGVADNPANEGKAVEKWEGLDYCGFFNSTLGATIKNLKIQYAGALFAVDSASGTKESGATFVGVAKNSTLSNLTSLQKDSGTGISISKGFGGIVGYLFGTTVDSCTNNVSATSLSNNKVGGIAMICQKDGCSILNCQNNGTPTTTSGEHGGIVGYTDTIIISNCENTAVCKMLYHHDKTITMQGENKGSANKISQTGAAVDGLSFAIVSGNVANFVHNADLSAGNSYKVMATGATATYELATLGDWIAFDTSLATPTYAITAAKGLRITSETVDTVTTYTAGPSIYLDPASLELYPNCSNYVHVVGAPAGSTYTYKFAGQVGSDSYLSNPPGWSKTEGWAWPYGKQPGGTGTITVTVTNDNAQVAQFVANVTVKDVAAVVDGVEYASADFTNALAAAKTGDKVLEVYYYASSYAKIALAEGESIRWKPADNRGKASFWTSAVTVPATTDAAWYKAVASKDNETGVTTITCVNQGAPYVKIDDGTTVTYSTESFTSMSKAGATYTLLRDMTNQSGGAVSKTGVILDLNGKKLGLATGIKVTAVNTAASLTIRDTSAAGTGEISGGNNDSPLVWALAGDTVTIESGTFVSDGSTVVYTSDGGTATISGGTFSTTAADKTFLLNCSDSNKGTITVTGGSFQGFDPANNAADGAGTCFVPNGYKSVYDSTTGYYTVQVAQQAVEIAPEAVGDTSYDSVEAAQAAANNVVIKPAAAVETRLSPDQLAAYKAMFEVKPVEAGSDAYKLTVALTSTALDTLQTQADADAATVIDGLADGEATIATVPGFYYSLVWGSELNNLSSETTRTLATGSTVTLAVPTDENATSGFYKVKISVAAE